MDNPATETTKPTPQSTSEAKFAEIEKDIQEKEGKIRLLRLFIEKHREPLSLFTSWKVFAFHGDIDYSNFDNHAKEIARAFGKDGWERKKHSYTCGAINWEKMIDGVKITIEAAETVKLNPIKEVKL